MLLYTRPLLFLLSFSFSSPLFCVQLHFLIYLVYLIHPRLLFHSVFCFFSCGLLLFFSSDLGFFCHVLFPAVFFLFSQLRFLLCLLKFFYSFLHFFHSPLPFLYSLFLQLLLTVWKKKKKHDFDIAISTLYLITTSKVDPNSSELYNDIYVHRVFLYIKVYQPIISYLHI